LERCNTLFSDALPESADLRRESNLVHELQKSVNLFSMADTTNMEFLHGLYWLQTSNLLEESAYKT